jgi:hypothetical protein
MIAEFHDQLFLPYNKIIDIKTKKYIDLLEAKEVVA